MAYVEGEIPLNTGNNATLAYPVMPYMPYGFGGGNGFGGDWSWIIILFLIAGAWGGNGFGGGFGGGNNMLYDINANTNRGFDNLALNSGIDALHNAVTGGTTDVIGAINTLSTNFQNCCCENRLATADLKYTVATENCADRQALSEGVRDIIASNTANTQAILDKLCQQEIDAKNDLIATLRSQVSMADLKASQTAQTAQILAGQINEIDALYNRLSNCPVPTTPVYGRVPIFTCNGGCGCQNVQ